MLRRQDEGGPARRCEFDDRIGPGAPTGLGGPLLPAASQRKEPAPWYMASREHRGFWRRCNVSKNGSAKKNDRRARRSSECASSSAKCANA